MLSNTTYYYLTHSLVFHWIRLGQGYVFTRVCDSVHRRGGIPACTGADIPWADSPPPPWADPTGSVGRPPTGQTPSHGQTPPPGCQVCIYWNAILFHLILLFKNLGINNGTSKQNSEKFNDFNNNSGVRSVAVRRFKFTESLRKV